MTNTPVAAVTRPGQGADERPQPPFRRRGHGEAHRGEAQQGVKHQEKPEPEQPLAPHGFPSAIPFPASVPTTMPASMGQSRRTSRLKLRPPANCQTLVTKEGTIRSEAALAGAMTSGQQAHRDGRQPEADHALHEAGDEEGEGCDNEGKVFDGHARLTVRRNRRLWKFVESLSPALDKKCNCIGTAARARTDKLAIARLAAATGEPVNRPVVIPPPGREQNKR